MDCGFSQKIVRLGYQLNLLFVVFHDFVVHDGEFNTCLLKHLDGVDVGMVSFLADHPFNARVYYHHGAGAAGRHLAKEGSAFEGDAKSGCLKDGVLFSMECADAVLGDFAIAVGDFA